MEKGREAIPSRVAFGAIYIKEQENLTDEGTVIYLSENPYAQYIMGLKEFRTEPLFEASMMVHFCKRFGPEAIRKVNQILYERMYPREKNPPEGQDGTPAEGNTNTDQEDDDNKGVMILDTTVAPADIHYPTDLNLVNVCREDTEKMIDRLWAFSSRVGHKTSYSRKKARRSFPAVAKQRKTKAKAIRRAVSEQIEYVGKNLETLESLVRETGEERLTRAEQERLETIPKVHEQQQMMRDTGVRIIADRIVSLRQPHVGWIMRGKRELPTSSVRRCTCQW